MTLLFSQLCEPLDNAMIEKLNAKVRGEYMDLHWFTSLEEAQDQVDNLRKEYNEDLPHGSLTNRQR